MFPPDAKPAVEALVWGVEGAVSWATATAAPYPTAVPDQAALLDTVDAVVVSPSAVALLVSPAEYEDRDTA
ncbi:hypothetical protein RSO01_60310 [Reyranella soli]|jgi:hypothetical protein|uniref:Uncharacterized protein n=1 Tax=Reyranella soli TaxID=1230389 RepID=A0A512NIX1_9HYPH|nr:hypothetical protein RSO01_60310 [Reyranella soli]